MNNLYILVGIPGSGKSTFAQRHMAVGDRVVSRDIIRFSLIKEGEPYFSKEKEVKKAFINAINAWHRFGSTYVDATNLTKKGREDLLNKINNKDIYNHIVCIYVKMPLETALLRNSYRTGRERVPDDAITNMYNRLEEPTFDEGFDTIVIVENDEIAHIMQQVEV